MARCDPSGLLAAGHRHGSPERRARGRARRRVVQTITLTNPQGQHLQPRHRRLRDAVSEHARRSSRRQPLTPRPRVPSIAISRRATDPDGAVLTWVLLAGPQGATIERRDRRAAAGCRRRRAASCQSVRPARLRHARRLRDAGVHHRRRGRRPRAHRSTFRPPPRLREGERFSLPVAASDPDGQVLSFLADRLPPGRALRQRPRRVRVDAGLRATRAMYRDVTFIVTDGINVVSRTVTFTVDQVNAPPVLRGHPEPHRAPGRPGELHRPRPPTSTAQALTYSLLDAPPGATIHPTTGCLHAGCRAFDSAASYAIRFRASDGAGDGERVRHLHRPQRATSRRCSIPSQSVSILENETLTLLQLFAFDADNPRLPAAGPAGRRHAVARRRVRRPSVTYAVVDLPEGATFDAVTGPLHVDADLRPGRPLHAPVHRHRQRRRHGPAAVDDAHAADRGAQREPRAGARGDRRDHGRRRARCSTSRSSVTDADGDGSIGRCTVSRHAATVCPMRDDAGRCSSSSHRQRHRRPARDAARPRPRRLHRHGHRDRRRQRRRPHAVLQTSRSFVVKVASDRRAAAARRRSGPKVAVIGQTLAVRRCRASDLDQDAARSSARRTCPPARPWSPGAGYGTAVFTWTPTAADARRAQRDASRSPTRRARRDSRSVDLTVRAANAPPVLLPGRQPDGRRGRAARRPAGGHRRRRRPAHLDRRRHCRRARRSIPRPAACAGRRTSSPPASIPE